MYVSASAWYTVVLPQHSSGVGALYRRTFMQLGLTIYVPMIIGQIIRNLFEERTTKFFNKWKLNKVAQLALLMLVWQTFDRAFETRAFETIPSSNMIFIVFISIVNWLVWLIVCFVTSVFWLPREDVISVCFCVPGKTLAVGIPLSTVLWTNTTLVDQGKLQIPMVVFQAFQVFLSSLLTIPLRKWAVTGKINQDQEEQVRSESSSADAQKEVTAGSHSKEGVGGKTEQELLPSAETV